MTLLRQDAQVRKSLTYDDTKPPSESEYETLPTNVEDDLNNLRSQLQNLLNKYGESFPTGNWWDEVSAPTSLEPGVRRGVNAVNEALHLLEKKRVLRSVARVGVIVSVGSGANVVVLGAGKLPGQTVAAVGDTTVLGTVVAHHPGVFGSASLAEVVGSDSVNPKNLVMVVDALTGRPVMSGGRVVWGLIQSEVAINPHTMNVTTQRVQLSFVRATSGFDDLELCPISDIQSKSVIYATRERVRFEDMNEADFGAHAQLSGSGITLAEVRRVASLRL